MKHIKTASVAKAITMPGGMNIQALLTLLQGFLGAHPQIMAKLGSIVHT